MGLEGVDPTPSLLSWAERTRDKLETMKNAREARIQDMYDQLEGLWQRLGVPVGDMDAFMDAHQGSTEAVVAAYEEELERMLELKRERMGTFVENARQEIHKLWDELMIGEEERTNFALMFDGACLRCAVQYVGSLFRLVQTSSQRSSWPPTKKRSDGSRKSVTRRRIS